MKGWKTYTFTELGLFHHRFTGSEEGLLRDRVKHGVACYVSGYHPLFVAASCVRRLAQKPLVIGSLAIMYGFLKAHVTRPPRLRDDRTLPTSAASNCGGSAGCKQSGDDLGSGHLINHVRNLRQTRV